jgi:membrane protease YdiL (CAAX protease family)
MDEPRPAEMTRLALLFEGGLGVAALACGWLLGHSPLVGLRSDSSGQQIAAVGWGLVATGPLLVALLIVDWLPLAALRRVREIASDVILRMFGGATVLQLAVVSLAAGFGEELLFRGLVQSGLLRWMSGLEGQITAVVLTSVLFGVCHWLNTTYAILAMLAGAYFGVLLLLTGNILAPIVAHAAYDFLALVYLIKPSKMLGSSVGPDDPAGP